MSGGLAAIIVIDYILRLFEAVLVIRAIVSWLPISHGNRLIELLYKVTEPILIPIRKLLNKTPLGNNMMFDLSPVAAFLLIELIRIIIR